eukprot:CAMPEP_0182472476 /NCGR_PEP_ID=MMETSP1319-20130603/22208_1 /TAXON_ID=172717 /ORGANISM="Bolidomonas pacifica, Strain RCC208" /LENGTH=112 /DNA_ID=CAMNT_0024673167 /DNA_START=8 /DNA_END=346 /DNA_ORIENTATION=+
MTMNLGQASLELSSPMSPPRPIPIPQPPGRSPPNNTPVHQPMTGSLFAQLQNDFLKFESLEEVVSASIAAHKDRIDCSSADIAVEEEAVKKRQKAVSLFMKQCAGINGNDDE